MKAPFISLETHREEIARLEAHHLDAQVSAMQRYEDLKKAHERERNYVIEECQRLRDEVERLRLYLTPSLQNVQLHREKDDSKVPVPDLNNPGGTPWMRFKAQAIREQEEAARSKRTVPVTAPEGETDGSLRERREPAPLSEPRKPS